MIPFHPFARFTGRNRPRECQPTQPMNAKIFTFLLLALIALPNTAAGEGESAGADKALIQLAHEKMAAAIRLDAMVDPAHGRAFNGVFISKEGLALIEIESLVWKGKPTAVTSDGTPLKLGRVLGLFPKADLDLMKFEHHPKTWVEFAAKDLEVGDAAAVIVTDTLKKTVLDGKVPPVVGNILAKRSCARGDYRKKDFTKILSLGSGLTTEQRMHLGGGAFVIDKDGHLVAFFYSQSIRKDQVLLELTPAVALADSIREMVKDDKAIPFPLAEANNPMDPILMDAAFNAMGYSRRMGNKAESRRFLKELLGRYPNSFFLKDTALDTWTYFDPDDPLVGLDDFAVLKSDSPVPDQVKTLDCRAFLLMEMARLEKELEARKRLTGKAIEARKSAIALSPEDEPMCRYFLAQAYFNLERFKDAESLMREAYPSYSDSIEFVEDFERILIKLGKWQEADKMADRVYELSEIYRR